MPTHSWSNGAPGTALDRQHEAIDLTAADNLRTGGTFIAAPGILVVSSKGAVGGEGIVEFRLEEYIDLPTGGQPERRITCHT